MNRRAFVLLAAAAAAARPALAQAPTRFSVKVAGAGPDVILIPGLACSGEVWDATAAKLSATHRTHVLTLPDFGGVAAGANAEGPIVDPVVEQIAAYIADQKMTRPAVIGHSLGGLIGQLLAARHPDSVGRLMIVDALPLYWLLAGPTATVDQFRPTAVMARDSTLAQTPEAFAAGQRAQVAGMTKPAAAQEKVLRWSLASDKAVVARALYEDMTTDARPLLPRIQAKTTVLYAYDASSPYPAANFDAVYGGAYATLPNKTLKRIDGSQHFIMFDQPDVFAREVDAFLG